MNISRLVIIISAVGILSSACTKSSTSTPAPVTPPPAGGGSGGSGGGSSSTGATTVPAAKEGQRIAPTTGAIFTLDNSVSALGEQAYRDPYGLIWGYPEMDSQSAHYGYKEPELMTYSEAEKYCQSKRLRLPTTQDFKRLAAFFGQGTPKGFSPFLNGKPADDSCRRACKDEPILPIILDNFWAAPADYYGDAKVFAGWTGVLVEAAQRSGVRCVAQSPIAATPESSQPVQTRVSTSGAVFTRDYSYPALGEAYKDPSGLIWGDVPRYDIDPKKKYLYSTDQILFNRQSDAVDYCKKINARLPTEADYIRLVRYLGSTDTDGSYIWRYNPYLADGKTTVLPNMLGNYWTSTQRSGGWAELLFSEKTFQSGGSGQNGFRCVMDSPKAPSK